MLNCIISSSKPDNDSYQPAGISPSTCGMKKTRYYDNDAQKDVKILLSIF
jgi:hypothetical protein